VIESSSGASLRCTQTIIKCDMVSIFEILTIGRLCSYISYFRLCISSVFVSFCVGENGHDSIADCYLVRAPLAVAACRGLLFC
jgi:hypothetical protein